MKVENHECFDDITNYGSEISMKDRVHSDVIEAKRIELENLRLYNTYEEVEDIGQDRITMRWVVTQKEKQDGQKKPVKARLVARGFQESMKPQSDSPTLLRESLKLFMAITANNDFMIRAIDIRAAFLQSEPLKKDIFILPPKVIYKDGRIWTY